MALMALVLSTIMDMSLIDAISMQITFTSVILDIVYL